MEVVSGLRQLVTGFSLGWRPGFNSRTSVFIVTPCIMDSLKLFHTNECTVIL